jgi:hypothetical protein
MKGCQGEYLFNSLFYRKWGWTKANAWQLKMYIDKNIGAVSSFLTCGKEGRLMFFLIKISKDRTGDRRKKRHPGSRIIQISQ